MWHWYNLLPQSCIYQSYDFVAAAIGFASIKATQLGDRLLAGSFITSAAANLGVTLFIGENYFLNNLCQSVHLKFFVVI
jgi:hypothetical protein